MTEPGTTPAEARENDGGQGGAIVATIVLCTRNRATMLPKALETLAGQATEQRFEVLVVDNASDDDTADVIHEWCRRDPRFQSVAEPRVGLSRAKNTGVEAARGPLILFTDDDVLVEPNWVDAYLALLGGRDGLVIAGGPILPILSDLSPWPDWLGEASLVDLPLLDHGSRARPLGRWEQLWGANMAVPRSVFERIGLWNEQIGRRGDERGTWEDLEFADRVRNSGGEVWFCPGAVVRHRISVERARPRPILRAAFRRGLDDYVKRVWASDKPAGAALTSAQRGQAFLTLTGHLFGWAWWALAFRFVRERRVLDRARDAAWSAGWRMMELTLRRTPESPVPVEPPHLLNQKSATARAIMQLCVLARRVALRLAPPS